MSDFKIITNTTADLPLNYINENRLGLMVFNYTIKGETYTKGKELDWKKFYALMREGHMPTTSQVNPEECRVILLYDAGWEHAYHIPGKSYGMQGIF